MRKYFYSDGNEKHGPYSLDELKNEEINKDTLIWFEGLDDWTPAKNLEEMKPILELQPPPIPISEKEKESENNKATTQNDWSENETSSDVKPQKGMFEKPFSFDGRIRRTEYAISFILYVIIAVIINDLIESGKAAFMGIVYIPVLWFLWAQGAKRCHDIGQSGWFQIIPFYIFWMIFAESENGINKYGIKPKN